MRLVLAWALAAAALLLAAACGSSADAEGEGGEAQQVLKEIESLQEGEILIRGLAAPRVTGPYRFKPGGYVLRFEQTVDGRMLVALESHPNSRRDPYQRLVATSARSGSAQVGLSGMFYVHVIDAAGDYTLRFTPKRKRP